MVTDKRVKATLTGHAEWAFRKFQSLTGRGDSLALEVIMDRWLRLDSELVSEFKLNAADFQRETGGGGVIALSDRSRSAAGQ